MHQHEKNRKILLISLNENIKKRIIIFIVINIYIITFYLIKRYSLKMKNRMKIEKQKKLIFNSINEIAILTNKTNQSIKNKNQEFINSSYYLERNYLKYYRLFVNLEQIKTNLHKLIKIKKIKILGNINNDINQNKISRIKRHKIYLNLAVNEKILDNNTYNESNSPKISIIIPCFNCAKFINKLITSIKNQKKMKDIEIIIVNDYSADNTSKVLNQLHEKDKRIKIINNNINKGILYSRSIGVLSSKGKYITTIDQDDLYIENNLLNLLYDYIDIFNYDIVKFIGYNDFNYQLTNKTRDIKYISSKTTFVLYQPELLQYTFSIKNYTISTLDMYIWNKIIRRNLYYKILYLLGDSYNHYLTSCEDTFINYYLNKYAKSLNFIRLYGLYHLWWEGSTMENISKKKNYGYFDFIQIKQFYNFPYKSKYDYKVIVNKLLRHCKNIISYINKFNTEKINYKNLINQILRNKRIIKNEKNQIQKKCLAI